MSAETALALISAFSSKVVVGLDAGFSHGKDLRVGINDDVAYLADLAFVACCNDKQLFHLFLHVEALCAETAR